VKDIKSDSSDKLTSWKQYYLSFTALLWVSLWLSINTGPWVLNRSPGGFSELINYARTISPFFVLVIAGFTAFGTKKGHTSPLSGPVKWWLVYGLVSLFACFMSVSPADAIYWAFIYLSVFAVLNAYVKGPDALNKAVHINYLSWFVTGAVLLVLLFIARDVLFVESRWGLTGYGIYGAMPTVADMPMSRSSGLARFAAIPGVIAFVLLWKGRIKRLVWAAVFVFSAILVYLMQSRGAILGFGFALSFVMLFLGRKTRAVGIFLGILIFILLFTDIIPEDFVRFQMERFMRGQDTDQFYSMTGRSRAWDNGWYEAMKSPVIGWGPQADRMLIDEHVHNTYLYTFLSAGFIGAVAFAGGIIYAWLIFFRMLKKGIAEKYDQKTVFIQIGGILAFFTIRSIPEVSGAMFGIDLMLMLPALVYLTVLYKTDSDAESTSKERRKIKIKW